MDYEKRSVKRATLSRAVLKADEEGLHGLVCELATDSAPEVREALARGLIERLARVSPLDRVERLCSWATSGHKGLRLAAALVLGRPLELVGATSCIEQLARDTDPEVRIAAARAARVRCPGDPMRCRSVLLELSRDGDGDVAGIAWRELAAV